MLAQIPINLFRLLILLLVQVLIFSNMRFSIFVNPYVFPLFVLLLPFETPRWLLMLIGMGAGLLLDFFLGTLGMHAAACLFVGYARPFLINIITPKGTEFEVSPHLFAQGVTWFFIYTTVTMFIYLSFYFLVEAGTFYNLFWLILKILSSTLVSVLFILILLYFFSSKKKRKYV
jgi:rod shape-determining protein MreD